ncbi:hypothetical protein BT69DRAFT_1036204 [Atractiella rhizophila]|nr:hypothetical protein BT69DRAFT_1036204 [Atractiella rhizophila]
MELHPPANADDGNSLGNIPNNNLNATNDVAIDALQGDIPLQQADIALGNGSISEEATGKQKNSVVYTWENRGPPATEGETTPAKVPISCLCCKVQSVLSFSTRYQLLFFHPLLCLPFSVLRYSFPSVTPSSSFIQPRPLTQLRMEQEEEM